MATKQSYSLLHYSKMKGKCNANSFRNLDGPHAIILAADSSLVNYALFKTETVMEKREEKLIKL